MSRRFVMLLVGFMGLGCQAPTSSVPAKPTYELVATRVLSNCTTRSCHSDVGRRGNLVLTPEQAYAALVDVVASNEAAKNRGKRRVVPGKPDASFLMQKLIAPAPDEGARMPLAGDPLPPEELELLRAWIEAGAKPPGSL